MFTGLIETTCQVKAIRRNAESMRLTLDLGGLAGQSVIGESIAVNGVCLTVTAIEGSLSHFDISAETLAKSTLGKLQSSSQVNIERAIKAGERFGGHFVQGHIDGTARIESIHKRSEFADIRFAAGAELLDAMVVKGSVAVDGISLTIATMDTSSFGISVIPETLKRTTLATAKTGDFVNIETDIIVKTVKKQLDRILPKSEPLTAERLKELGF